MKNETPKNLIKQAYSDPFYIGVGKREDRPFYNPFIDIIYLPFPIEKGLSLNEKWEFNLEYSHYHFALEISRFNLKMALGLVYKGIHDYLRDPETPPLKIPTFRNAPAVRELCTELMRIYQEFEPIEEVLTLAMEVSQLESEGESDLREYEYFMSFKEQSSTIEREGLYSIKKNFSPQFIKAYYNIMDLTGRDPGSIYLLGTHLLCQKLGPLLIFDGEEDDYFDSEDLTEFGRKFRQAHDIVKEDGLTSTSYPEKWYSKNLLTPEGIEKLWEFYLNSRYAPEAQFFNYIDFLKYKREEIGKKSSSFEQLELRKIMNQAFQPKTPHKIKTLLWWVHSAYITERPDPKEADNVLDRTYFRASQMLDQKTVGIFLEHKNFFEKRTDLTERKALGVLEKAVDNMPANYFTREFRGSGDDSKSEEKDLHSLVFFYKDGQCHPDELANQYKDLLTWESIRQQFYYLTDLEEFELPWEDEDTKELEAFIRENVTIDYAGMNKGLSAIKEDQKKKE